MKVEELFDIYQGNSFELINMTQNAFSDINFVARTSENNGVVAKVDLVQKEPFPAGLITVAVGGSVLSSFVQNKPFYTGFHVLVLKTKKEMSLEEKLFYCSAIKRNAYRYGFGRQANKTLKYINLPELPAWIKTYKIDYTPIQTHIEKKDIPFDVTNWKQFKISDLFECFIAHSEDFGNATKGSIPFIGRSVNDNGLQGYVDTDKLNKGQCITIGMVGTMEPYWQEKDFAASQNILMLYNKNLNKYSALFLTTMLKHIIKDKYSYNRPIQKEKFKNNLVKLPIDSQGNPDWLFMENYIKSLPYSDLI